MDALDRSIISVFTMKETKPELMQAMRDITSLAGVLQELGDREYFQAPIQVLRMLRVLQIINEEALGLSSMLDNERTIYYRYQNTYPGDSDITIPFIEHIVYILGKYNWVSRTAKRIRMMSVGKRLMDNLLRLANDSLAYYLNDDVARSLFQAKRDAEISEAYDDRGISGGNTLASMIRNVEEAVEILQERELEYLADRNALPQVEIIHGLMEDLEQKMEQRFASFQTLEESIPLADLMQRGTKVITEGTTLSIGTIGKIVKFSHLTQTEMTQDIRPDLFRRFISSSFDSPADSTLPNAHQILSFMEQDEYPGEYLDGLWVPVKFASPIGSADISRGITYIENYEPVQSKIEDDFTVVFASPEQFTSEEAEQKLQDIQWKMVKQQIDTEKAEQYLDTVKEAALQDFVLHVGSTTWNEAIHALLALATLTSNERAVLDQTEISVEITDVMKEWEWVNHDDGKKRVRNVRRDESV